MHGPIRFTGVQADINNATNGWKPVAVDWSGDRGSQVARFFATTDAGSGDATLTVALVVDNTLIALDTATITPTARRTAADGTASGRYVATVEFAVSGTDKIDLLGHGLKGTTAPITDSQLPSETRNAATWWYGITALSTVANVDVYHAVSPHV